MAAPRWTYMLRIMKRDPDRFRMDRLADYMREFADLLGVDNNPVFKGIKKASTGLKAEIPQDRRPYAHARLTEAKTNPSSKAGKVLHDIEAMLAADGIDQAQLLDASEKVVHLFSGIAVQVDPTTKIHQDGFVDGTVTGLVGADETIHLHLRDPMGHDLRLLVRDEELARKILRNFRIGTIRAYVRGSWIRTDDGWAPEANRCTLASFEVLDDAPAGEVFAAMAKVEGNGWSSMDAPQTAWAQLRGVH